MQNILYISCSPKGPDAISETFGQELLTRLVSHHPDATITRRYLSAAPPPLIDAAFATAITNPSTDPAAFAASEILINELEQAGALVIVTPMHNFTVPAALKAWIDQIVRIHRTFASTPQGKIGKLPDRPVYIVIASGGWFTRPTPTGAPAQPDFLTPYLRTILNTIGLATITFFTLEGVTRGSEPRLQAFTDARQALDQSLPPQ